MTIQVDTNFVQPCNDCLFRRVSAPGWLGPWTPPELLDAISYDGFPCHQTIPESFEDDYELADQDDEFDTILMESCAGAALYLNSKLELSRDPTIAEHQGKVKDADEEIKQGVFSTPQEFFDHHNQFGYFDDLKGKSPL